MADEINVDLQRLVRAKHIIAGEVQNITKCMEALRGIIIERVNALGKKSARNSFLTFSTDMKAFAETLTKINSYLPNDHKHRKRLSKCIDGLKEMVGRYTGKDKLAFKSSEEMYTDFIDKMKKLLMDTVFKEYEEDVHAVKKQEQKFAGVI